MPAKDGTARGGGAPAQVYALPAVYGTPIAWSETPERRRNLQCWYDEIEWPPQGTGGPGSQAIFCLVCALKDSREDDEVGSNKGDGDDPVDPDQAVDAEYFEDVIEFLQDP